MAKNHVEAFCCDGTHDELEATINRFCKNHDYNPISVSVIWSAGTYVALVVVEECWEGNGNG